MKKNPLKEIEGIKIRWQYFTGILIVALAFTVFVPYCMLVFSLFFGNFVFSEWLDALRTFAVFGAVGSAPLVLLSVLNRFFFGKIVCVVNTRGIHWADGLIRWDDVDRLEYELSYVSRWGSQYCHANVFTRAGKVTLVHAPLFLLSYAKKYKPDIHAKLSQGSVFALILMAVGLLIVPLLIPLFG